MDHTLVFQKSVNVYLMVANLTMNFPKMDRYALGIRLEIQLLELIEHVVTAENTVSSLKDRELICVAAKADVCAVLARLALERQLINITNYFALSENLHEIARMATGWRKSLDR